MKDIENFTPEQREEIKRNRLEYLYQIPNEYDHLPLLGSAVRALGKGWSVEVIVGQEHMLPFENLRQSLSNPQLLSINTISTGSDLLLVSGLDYESTRQKRDSLNVLGKQHVMVAGSEKDDNYDLISRFDINQLSESGVIAITGNGKGKTTTALGIATEALVKDQKIAIIQWFKERKAGRMTWSINEHYFPELLIKPDAMRFEPTGIGFFGSPTMDRVSEYKEHRAKAYEGLVLAKQVIDSGDYSVVVLDEFVDTVPKISQNIEVPLIDLIDVQEMLKFALNQNKTKVVVTGRQVTPEWEDFIQNSITISEVRHPWSAKHQGAVSGLDF